MHIVTAFVIKNRFPLKFFVICRIYRLVILETYKSDIVRFLLSPKSKHYTTSGFGAHFLRFIWTCRNSFEIPFFHLFFLEFGQIYGIHLSQKVRNNNPNTYICMDNNGVPCVDK